MLCIALGYESLARSTLLGDQVAVSTPSNDFRQHHLRFDIASWPEHTLLVAFRALHCAL